MSKKIQPEHDELFRKAMEFPEAVREFLDEYLPDDVKALIDINSCHLENESFIEENLENSIGDVLLSAKYGDEDGYIYIMIEHQSQPHKFMALRMFKYMLNIMDRHITRYPNAKKLPLIYPMIFYNGKQKYNVSRNLWDLFERGDKAKAFWSGDHQVVNLNDIPDEEFKKRPWAGTMAFLMKYIRSPKLLQKWREIACNLPALETVANGLDYIKLMVRYTLTMISKDDTMSLKDLILKSLKLNKGEEVMITAAQYLRQEGGREALREKMHMLAIEMLEDGMDIAKIAKFTKLSVQEISSIKKKNAKCA